MRLTYNKNQNFKISPVISPKFYLTIIFTYDTVSQSTKDGNIPKDEEIPGICFVLISKLIPTTPRK